MWVFLVLAIFPCERAANEAALRRELAELKRGPITMERAAEIAARRWEL